MYLNLKVTSQDHTENITMHGLITLKVPQNQTTEVTSAKFLKMFYPRYILLRIQRLGEGGGGGSLPHLHCKFSYFLFWLCLISLSIFFLSSDFLLHILNEVVHSCWLVLAQTKIYRALKNSLCKIDSRCFIPALAARQIS